MTDRTAETKPQTYARIGGVLYLIIIAAGLFAQAFVQDKLIVPADAAATATNIMAHYPRHSEARLWLPFIVSPFLLDWQLLHRQLTQGFAALELLFVGTLYGPAVLD